LLRKIASPDGSGPLKLPGGTYVTVGIAEFVLCRYDLPSCTLRIFNIYGVDI